MKFFSTFLLMILVSFGAVAQKPVDQPSGQWIHLIHTEMGFIFPKKSITENLAVRQNISSYYSDQSSQGHISASTFGFHGGFRYEFYNPGKRLGLSAGIRFTTYTTTIAGYSSKNADFFYLRYSSEGVDTKFARVNSISENNKHVGIPLEIKYTPFGFKKVRFYLKAGIEPSYSVHQQTGIEFHDPAMEAYKEAVKAGFNNEVATFTSSVYPVIGIQVGNQKFHGINFEILLPSFYLSDDNFGLIETSMFSGFRASYQFPIGK